MAKFPQEFVGGNIERILLEDAADDDHRVRSHDLDHLVATKLIEMIGTNDRVFVTPPNFIYARFEFNHIVDV